MPIDETVSLRPGHQRGGIQKGRTHITYQAPTKCTLTSSCENAFLKRSAIDIGSCDPTSVAVGSSLLGSAYNSYALNMINKLGRKVYAYVRGSQWYLHLVPLINEANLQISRVRPCKSYTEHIVLSRSLLRARGLGMLHEKTLNDHLV